MNCDKERNLNNGWNRYCTFVNNLPFVKNDTISGVYLGCPCKQHDIGYSINGKGTKKDIDLIFKRNIYKEFLKANRKIEGLVWSNLFYVGVRIFGFIFWRNWESKGVQRYK